MPGPNLGSDLCKITSNKHHRSQEVTNHTANSLRTSGSSQTCHRSNIAWPNSSSSAVCGLPWTVASTSVFWSQCSRVRDTAGPCNRAGPLGSNHCSTVPLVTSNENFSSIGFFQSTRYGHISSTFVGTGDPKNGHVTDLPFVPNTSLSWIADCTHF